MKRKIYLDGEMYEVKNTHAIPECMQLYETPKFINKNILIIFSDAYVCKGWQKWNRMNGL